MTALPSTTDSPSRRFLSERVQAILVAVVVMLITLVPYLVGYSRAEERRFLWLGYNLDDSCVYLSWMRQAADGSLRALNLFTTEPQHGMALNPFFLVLGKLAGITGLPLIAMYHLSRVVFGVCLLALVWEFLCLTLADRRARWMAFLCVCFASGLGWLPNWWEDNPLSTPIDKWQPEAITFLSLYLSPLFVFSMILQVGLLLLLLQGERQGRARYAVWAGLCGFLLGLIHGYDVITMSAVWLVYLLVQTFAAGKDSSRPSPLSSWLRALLAGAITAPAVLYVFLQLRTETVFRTRVNVPTLSPALAWVVLGYGLTLALAAFGVRALQRNREFSARSAYESADAIDDEDILPEPLTSRSASFTTGQDAARLLVIWAIANVVVSYLPVAFQRKMLQGAHFPIAILAGVGMAALLNALRRNVAPRQQPIVAALILLILSMTNIRFMVRDIANFAANISQTHLQRAYLQPGEMQAMEWVATHTPKDAAIQPLPWVGRSGDKKAGAYDTTLAGLTPGLIDRAVYCGHWGETPDFPAKLNELFRFGTPIETDAERLALLRKMQVRYLVFTQKAPNDPDADDLAPMFRGKAPLPPYLTHVYPDSSRGEINEDADVYAVDPSIFSYAKQ